LKFGDIITAVASYGVLQILIAFLVSTVALPVLVFAMEAYYVIGLTSVFLSMLIVGYLFGEEIRKGRRNAILRIVVLSAFYELFVVVFQPTLADWSTFAKETHLKANPGTTFSTLEWFLYDLSRRGNMFFNIIIVAALGFIGLYFGSMLKQSSKT
jgi:hypothetical protein